MLAKKIFYPLGLLLLFGLKQPSAYCQASRAPSHSIFTEGQPEPRRAYVRRTLKRNRINGLLILNNLGFGGGASYDRLITSTFHLSFSAAYTLADLSGGTAFEANEFLKSETVSLSFSPRYYYWRRFYISTGLHVSAINGEFGFEGSDIDTPDKRSFRTFSSYHGHGDIRLGNEWRFDNFFIGLDWFGVSYYQHSILEESEMPIFNGQSRFFTGQDSDQRITQELSKQLQFTYGTLRIGMQF